MSMQVQERYTAIKIPRLPDVIHPVEALALHSDYQIPNCLARWIPCLLYLAELRKLSVAKRRGRC